MVCRLIWCRDLMLQHLCDMFQLEVLCRCWSDKMPLEGNCLSLHILDGRWVKMAQGQFAMEGKCPSPNLTASQWERHFPSGWGHFDSICLPEGVIVPFCHCMGAFCHGKSTKGSMCHFVMGWGHFATGKAQLLGGILSQDGGTMSWRTVHSQIAPIPHEKSSCVCVGGAPSQA